MQEREAAEARKKAAIDAGLVPADEEDGTEVKKHTAVRNRKKKNKKQVEQKSEAKAETQDNQNDSDGEEEQQIV